MRFDFLGEETVEIIGIGANVGNARGSYPVSLRSKVLYAVAMRVGNTVEEMNLSEWRSYQSELQWLVPTGSQEKTVFVQYQMSDVTTSIFQVVVPYFAPEAGPPYVWPLAPDPLDPLGNWHQAFETGADYWISYDYNADRATYENVFYAASWASQGGSDGGGFIFADDSRWRIDTPETPALVFPLAIRSEWLDPRYNHLDFDGHTASFDLKATNLDLKGGQAYLYVYDTHGRVVKFDQPLLIENGLWVHNQVTIGSLNDDAWDVTFLPNPGLIDATKIASWGIAFAGFTEEPTGILALDQFSIVATAPSVDVHAAPVVGVQITVHRADGLDDTALATCALINGGYVTAWQSTGTPGQSVVKLQVSMADGSQLHASSLADAGAVGSQLAPALAALPGGGFMAAWSTAPAGPGGRSMLLARNFDSEGNPQGAAFELDSSIATELQHLAIASRPDGGFSATWLEQDSGAGVQHVLFRSFGGDVAHTADAKLELGLTSGTTPPGLVLLADGSTAVCWCTPSSPDGESRVVLCVIDPHGQLLAGHPVLVASSAMTLSQPSLAVLSGGDLLLCWTASSLPDQDSGLAGRVLSPQGEALGEEFRLGDAARLTGANMAALGTGNEFLVTWIDANDQGRPTLRGRILSGPLGLPGTDTWTLETAAPHAGGPVEAAPLVLSDGRALLTWIDQGDGTAQAGTALRAQFVQAVPHGVRLLGTAIGEDWVGTPYDDEFFGNGGPDRIAGGLGNDRYHLGSPEALAIERAGQGSADQVFVNFDYQLAGGAHIEILSTEVPSGTLPFRLSGNEFANAIYGNAGDNTLNYLAGDGPADTLAGGDGNDWYFVYRADDQVIEGTGGGRDRVFTRGNFTLPTGQEIEVLTSDDHGSSAPLVLTGNEFNNDIYGNAGNNVLTGGGGADTFVGMAGDDWYYVDSADDVVLEFAGEGDDRVLAHTDYTLAPDSYVEKVTTDNNFGTLPIRLTGNDLVNVIFGNLGDNVLDGRGGADTLVGLAGDDRYLVDNAGDVVLESIGGGNDIVLTSVNYNLRAGQEVETLTTTDDAGTEPVQLTGNELSNTLIGNAGDNILDGKAGTDLLVGLDGADWFFVDSPFDRVVEQGGGGNDRVLTSSSYSLEAGQEIEKLTPADNFGTAPIDLTGNEFANAIYGNAGDNIIDGRGGNDQLIGMGGNDSFLFSMIPGLGGLDMVLDFDFSNDKFLLDHVAFAGLQEGRLSQSAFEVGSQASSADVHIILDPTTSTVFYDADGAGGQAAVPFLVIPGAWVSADQFFVV